MKRTRPPRASHAPPPPPQSPSPFLPSPSNEPPDPSPAARNSTATNRPSSPPTPQEVNSGIQTMSKHLQFGSITSEHEPQPPGKEMTTGVQTRSKHIQVGGITLSITSEHDPHPPGLVLGSPTHNSDATRQSPADRNPPAPTPPVVKPTLRDSSTSSRSPVELEPPGVTPSSLGSRSSDATRPQPQERTETTKFATLARGSSSSRSPADLQTPGITTASLRSRSFGDQDTSTARRNSPTPTPHVTSGDCKNANLAQGNSPASSSPHQLRDMSSPLSGKVLMAKEPSPMGPLAGVAVAQDGNIALPLTEKRWVVKTPSHMEPTAAVGEDVKRSGGKNNSSSGDKVAWTPSPMKPPPAVPQDGKRSGDKNNSSSGDKVARTPSLMEPPPAVPQDRNRSGGNNNSLSDDKVARTPSPMEPPAAVARDRKRSGGKNNSSSGDKVARTPSPMEPPAAVARDRKRSGGKNNSSSSDKVARTPSPMEPPAAVAQDANNVPTGSGGKNSSTSADKGSGRYNLRPRHVPPVEHKPATTRLDSASQSVNEPPPLEQPAATPPNPSDPSTRRRRSSLTINDDAKTLKLYLQYLKKHERPNAILLLLSGTPRKFSINFKKLLRSNRALGHTICNNKDRIWSLLLETTKTFLSQQFKDFNIRAQIEGVSDEKIQIDILDLELVFVDLPWNICTLVDFLDTTILTVIEDILEGHKITVPSDEGRRLLYALVSYLIAHHKEGKAWGGNWNKEDWDVVDSWTVSLSKEPYEFTDDRVPAKDMARLGSSVVPRYLTRGHLNLKPNQRLKLLFAESFRNDLKDNSGLSTEDYHELMCSHPFIMPSESRADFLIALYHFFKTFNWEFNVHYNSVFADLGLSTWRDKITHGNSRALKKVFWFGWDRTNNGYPYSACLGHLLVFDRHALEHIRNHEQRIRKMIQLELLVSSRSPEFLARVIRLMFQHGKMVGEMKRRWDIYVGAGTNKRL